MPFVRAAFPVILRFGALVFPMACAARAAAIPTTIPGVRFEAAVDHDRAGPSRRFVRARATLMNAGRDTARVAVWGCVLNLHAYAPDERDGAPVWTSARAHRACPDVRRTLRVAPGHSAVFEESFAVDATARTGPPPGRYAFAVSMMFLEPATTSPEYPAGVLTIR